MSKRFKSQDHFRYKRLGKRWRRPVGWQSKLRLKKGGSGMSVAVGYRSPVVSRGKVEDNIKEKKKEAEKKAEEKKIEKAEKKKAAEKKAAEGKEENVAEKTAETEVKTEQEKEE
ncbi:hypothetical protein HYZ41_01825 [archaeon]|nr:hypothetical protein [archaeon]